ncbi:hypothetical protein HN51_067849 [Arachis hypogaea]
MYGDGTVLSSMGAVLNRKKSLSLLFSFSFFLCSSVSSHQRSRKLKILGGGSSSHETFELEVR